MKIYVVRHGETKWNVLHKVQGVVDIPLAEAGIILAQKTGEALKNVHFDVCFTSPLQRARQTAELILREQKDNVPVITDDRIREINFGVLEGMVCRDKDGNYLNEDMKTFFTDPLHFKRPEDGENISDVIQRTREFWEEKINDPALQDKTVLVASHGCAVRALLQNIYQDPENFWHGCIPPNCSVNLIEVTDGRARFLEEDKVYA
ncbi:histidine phosphatase family protein [Blautia sp. HCP28S3_G10]|uniref:histidine phosphatase family protein n=1 Tax=Blautia sp. HCP28S3_G10 TaxID=3438908 RepID=UPI003F8B118C